MKCNSALLIFARTASEESKYKSFKASKAFFQQQNKQVLKLAKTSGLDYFWIDEHQQIGQSFEERFLNAIQTIFDQGYSDVISIGNDSPELEVKHIDNALLTLNHSEVCFGPSIDGGFYLWGIKKEVFSKTSFLNFSWKTEHLLAEILSYLEENTISASCLEALADLDHRKDAFYFVHSSKLSAQLLSILLKMLQNEPTELLSLLPSQKPYYSKVYYNKGSPLAA